MVIKKAQKSRKSRRQKSNKLLMGWTTFHIIFGFKVLLHKIMEGWMNEVSSKKRYLHKMVQDLPTMMEGKLQKEFY